MPAKSEARSARAPASADRRVAALIVPGDIDQPTGGYRYDARMAEELRNLGWSIDILGLAGRFPDADDDARAALEQTLRARPDGSLVVVDGLALGGLPEIAERHAMRLTLVGLVHHPLADETGLAAGRRARLRALEARALAACRQVVTTSRFTARRVAEMLDVPESRIATAEPGVDPEPAPQQRAAADGDGPRHLLCVGSLVPRKGQDVLVDALAPLNGFDWQLELVGDTERDPRFASKLRAHIERWGLGDRIRCPGVQRKAGLDACYRRADLLVVPSHYEGYGMVVTEALARGLPLIATDGGALAHTVPARAALRVPAGDRDALTAALRSWLLDSELRRRLVAGALDARAALTDWATAGRRFAELLDAAGRHR